MTVSRPEPDRRGAPGGTDPALSGAASDPHALLSRFFARAGSQPHDHLRNFSPRPNTHPRSWRPPIHLPPVESRPRGDPGAPGGRNAREVSPEAVRFKGSAKRSPTRARVVRPMRSRLPHAAAPDAETSPASPHGSAPITPAAAAGTSSLPAVRQPDDVQTQGGGGLPGTPPTDREVWPLPSCTGLENLRHPDTGPLTHEQLLANARTTNSRANAPRHNKRLAAALQPAPPSQSNGERLRRTPVERSRLEAVEARLPAAAPSNRQWGAAPPHDPRAAAADDGHHHARLAGGGWLP